VGFTVPSIQQNDLEILIVILVVYKHLTRIVLLPFEGYVQLEMILNYASLHDPVQELKRKGKGSFFRQK